MILSDVIEKRKENDLEIERKLSQCVISSQTLLKIEMLREIYEKLPGN